MSPGITDVDETAAAGPGLGGMIDEAEMDRQTPIRRTEHPFGQQVERVRDELQLPNSQSVREVVSAICGHVGRLSVVTEDDVDAQAEHIGSLVAEDRKAMKDPQLWDGPATKVAAHVLKLRLEGKAIIADSAEAEAA
jgi:hypothetical protein